MIATRVAVAGTSVSAVEKAAGLPSGALQSYLDGGDIAVASLVKAGGLLSVSPEVLFGGAA